MLELLLYIEKSRQFTLHYFLLLLRSLTPSYAFQPLSKFIEFLNEILHTNDDSLMESVFIIFKHMVQKADSDELLSIYLTAIDFELLKDPRVSRATFQALFDLLGALIEHSDEDQLTVFFHLVAPGRSNSFTFIGMLEFERNSPHVLLFIVSAE